MFQGHRKLNVHQLTRSFCSSCLSGARAFIWEGEMGVALQAIWHPIKRPCDIKLEEPPHLVAQMKRTPTRNTSNSSEALPLISVTTFFQPKRKVQKVTLLLGSAILQYFSIKVIVHPNHNLLTLMLFQTRLNLFCGAQKFIFWRTEEPYHETQWGKKKKHTGLHK